MNAFEVHPIGYFHAQQKEKYAVPRQPTPATRNEGVIKLNPHLDFEQALEGLKDFERIWILFHFHRNSNWKPKVLPPRGGKKQGVFATRSPHRPNFIGMSCVELVGIDKLNLYISHHDLIDKTPILDIKPYLNYADSFQCTRQGWLDGLESEMTFEFQWSTLASEQIAYLLNEWKVELKEIVEMRLQTNPYPTRNNRVDDIGNGIFELGFKTWRIHYQIKGCIIEVLGLKSGYDDETLMGIKPSRWNDLPTHLSFLRLYPF
jgi:tRNA-Thr(GGU) m(6)t(6)A37 methyltransferase TsaA